jgi:hypothetical protein
MPIIFGIRHFLVFCLININHSTKIPSHTAHLLVIFIKNINISNSLFFLKIILIFGRLFA